MRGKLQFDVFIISKESCSVVFEQQDSYSFFRFQNPLVYYIIVVLLKYENHDYKNCKLQCEK